MTWVTGTLVGTGISASALAAGLGSVWPLAMVFAGVAFLAASPFRWYGAAIQDGLDVSHIAGLTLVAIALAAIGAQLFERRDVL